MGERSIYERYHKSITQILENCGVIYKIKEAESARKVNIWIKVVLQERQGEYLHHNFICFQFDTDFTANVFVNVCQTSNEDGRLLGLEEVSNTKVKSILNIVHRWQEKNRLSSSTIAGFAGRKL